MKKKVLILAAALAVLCAAEGFSQVGLGGQIGVTGVSSVGDYGHSWSFGEFSFLWSPVDVFHISVPIGWSFSQAGYLNIAVNIDWWLLNLPIIPTEKVKLVFFLGPGLGVNMGFWGNGNKIGGVDWSAYGRIPIGLSLKIKQKYEIFGQIVPTVGLRIPPSFYWSAGGYIGFRYWFL